MALRMARARRASSTSGAGDAALALGLAPDGLGKVAVVEVARDEMPVQVGNHVAEAGQVDLLGAEAFPHATSTAIRMLKQWRCSAGDRSLISATCSFQIRRQ
jgi:hypothetical protein